ncbi:hypothetical protein AAFF_G00237580 [Aldrovandia affinis]|uniref:Uncharacterized protein n=1 Tax=Aldrovandia affinis TaxID=143900 RepID=A0AAD7W3A3_9TELE|nr:hypothetical protein AAFF_G00237580 [Aldrovandia affinis]
MGFRLLVGDPHLGRLPVAPHCQPPRCMQAPAVRLEHALGEACHIWSPYPKAGAACLMPSWDSSGHWACRLHLLTCPGLWRTSAEARQFMGHNPHCSCTPSCH